MSGNEQIILVSSDKVRFEVSRKTAERSILLKNMLTDLCNDDVEQFEIPVPGVKGATLKRVIQWAEHHKDTVLPDNEDDDTRKSAPLDEWDRKFLQFNGDQEALYNVILASNYLNIGPLLDACCKSIAEMIRGKSPEQIRETFKIDLKDIAEELQQTVDSTK